MEANSSAENGNTRENENVGFVNEVDGEEEDEEILKRRISSHPLYGLLIQTHLNCLKVGLGEVGTTNTAKEATNTTNTANTAKEAKEADFSLQATIQTSPELDSFMEAYCITLKKLKQAMEEPIQETSSFIDAMYFQLRELTEPTQPTHPNNPKPTSPTH